MIEILRGCNFHIRFSNGVTVSILIGGGSYSDNHDDIGLIGHEQELKHLSSFNAEIAAWEKDGRWITKELRPDATDTVLGWQTPEEILDFMNKAAMWRKS